MPAHVVHGDKAYMLFYVRTRMKAPRLLPAALAATPAAAGHGAGQAPAVLPAATSNGIAHGPAPRPVLPAVGFVAPAAAASNGRANGVYGPAPRIVRLAAGQAVATAAARGSVNGHVAATPAVIGPQLPNAAAGNVADTRMYRAPLGPEPRPAAAQGSVSLRERSRSPPRVTRIGMPARLPAGVAASAPVASATAACANGQPPTQQHAAPTNCASAAAVPVPTLVTGRRAAAAAVRVLGAAQGAAAAQAASTEPLGKHGSSPADAAVHAHAGQLAAQLPVRDASTSMCNPLASAALPARLAGVKRAEPERDGGEELDMTPRARWLAAVRQDIVARLRCVSCGGSIATMCSHPMRWRSTAALPRRACSSQHLSLVLHASTSSPRYE